MHNIPGAVSDLLVNINLFSPLKGPPGVCTVVIPNYRWGNWGKEVKEHAWSHTGSECGVGFQSPCSWSTPPPSCAALAVIRSPEQGGTIFSHSSDPTLFQCSLWPRTPGVCVFTWLSFSVTLLRVVFYFIRSTINFISLWSYTWYIYFKLNHGLLWHFFKWVHSYYDSTLGCVHRVLGVGSMDLHSTIHPPLTHSSFWQGDTRSEFD